MELSPRILDIGEGRWEESPYKTWVSKSDVGQFHRCPYKVYLSFTEGISYDHFLTASAINSLVKPGVDFEDYLVESPPPDIRIELVESMQDGLNLEGVIQCRQLVLNQELGYAGIPDLVFANRGEFIPIEIKSHKKATSADRLELAFYWRLLEPLRNHKITPRGYLLLRDRGLREVPLSERDFRLLEDSVTNVRKTREEGVDPVIVSECKLCTFKDEHARLAREAEDLSLIRDIGSSRREKLVQLGIKKVGDLASANVGEVWDRWSRADRYAPTPRQLLEMQSHAVALVTNEPQFIGDGAYPFLEKGILIDLEYESGQYIFLAGACVSDGKQKAKTEQWFADRIKKDEAGVLNGLCSLLSEHPDHRIITWNGMSADIPQLRSAWKRCGLSKHSLDKLTDRHIDAYKLAYENVRLPTWGLKLPDVSGYFGHRRKFRDLSGLEIPLLYHDYLRTKKKSDRESLRTKILQHNLDDLNGLLRAWKGLQGIASANMAQLP